MKNFYVLLLIQCVGYIVNGQSNQPCVPCLPQGITFTTQSQIDSFQINYPGCTQVEGGISIYGNDITNLNGLTTLTSIGGELRIGGLYYPTNPILTSLTGLENLTSIGDRLFVDGNIGLTSLTGLEGLTSIGGSLFILNNDSLTSLTGLEGLISIGYSLLISGNPLLTSLTELENITCINGELRIGENNALSNLSGLENLTSIGSTLEIAYNDSLTSVMSLEGVTFVGGDLSIDNNDALTSLAGLENITSIGGSLLILYASFTNLTGLEGVTSIGGALNISYSDVLSSLAGLGDIDAGSITTLVIYSNYYLSDCAVNTICEYLVNPSGWDVIYDNDTGCNSIEEVKDSCEITSVVNLSSTSPPNIYPNPASTTITIESPSKGTLSIHSTSGQQLLQQEITEPATTIDVSGWKSGVYLVKVVCEKGVQVGKFIKQ